MTEIFQEAIKGYNLPLTILLGLIGLYWVITMFGLIDNDTIDGALGLDGGDGGDIGDAGDIGDVGDAGDVGDVGDASDVGDGDGEFGDGHDHSHDGQAVASSGNALHSFLRFLGAGDAPLMFIISVFVLYLWGGNIFANLTWNGSESASLATLLLLGVFVGAFVLTKLTIRPLRPVMKLIRTNENRKPLIGQTGTVRSKQLTDEFGQIEVIAKGASLLLNARLSDGCDPIDRGSEVLLVAKDKDRDLLIARPISLESIHQSN